MFGKIKESYNNSKFAKVNKFNQALKELDDLREKTSARWFDHLQIVKKFKDERRPDKIAFIIQGTCKREQVGVLSYFSEELTPFINMVFEQMSVDEFEIRKKERKTINDCTKVMEEILKKINEKELQEMVEEGAKDVGK